LDIGIAEHPSDVACVNFNDEIVDSDEVEAGSMEGTKEPVELKLGLRIAGLVFIPQNRAEAQGAAASGGAVLRENPSYAADR